MALSIPLYRQTSDFSCGAASLVMALGALRNRPTTRSEEFEFWRVATMIGIPGIDQWGLSVAALKCGVPARVIASSEFTFPHARSRPRWFTEQQVEITTFAQRENHRRAHEAGVSWDRRAPATEDIRAALSSGCVPVVLVDLHTLSKGADIAPHWVVAVREEGGVVTVHDPAPEGPGVHALKMDEVWACMDVSRYEAAHTVVVLGP